jgi:putative transposase
VAHLCSVHQVSQRRACRAIGVDRTSIRYRHCRIDDRVVRTRLRKLACIRRRFGWSRLHMLSREGMHVNHKMLRRLYAGERQVCQRNGRKRALEARVPLALAQGLNQRLSLDFVSDMLTNGRRFPILAMVDDSTVGDFAWSLTLSLPGPRVSKLDLLVVRHSRPLCCNLRQRYRAHQHAILRGSQTTAVEWPYIGPGKPTQNALSRVSTAGCATSFTTRRCSSRLPRRASPSRKWSRDYNTQRPHSALGNLTPARGWPILAGDPQGPTVRFESRGISNHLAVNPIARGAEHSPLHPTVIHLVAGQYPTARDPRAPEACFA